MGLKKMMSVFLVVFLIGVSYTTTGRAATDLEWSVIKTLNLEAKPVDMVLSSDGNQLYILTEGGEVLVYAGGNSPIHKMNVGSEFDRIEISPTGEVLILTSRNQKKANLLRLVFIQDINISGAPFKGPEDAPVVIVIFTDFQCPYCSKTAPILDQLFQKYPEDVKIVIKNFPLRNHKFAMKAAESALAAGKKGKFWEYHDLLFKNYKQLDDEKIRAITREVGLDETEFESLMKNPDIKGRIQKDVFDGRNAGVKGTPSIFINGKATRNVSFQGLDAAVQWELQKIKKEAGKTSP